mgnify:CR=1 FL=1
MNPIIASAAAPTDWNTSWRPPARRTSTKISSLPKPNIVVMDEVFGKIADENLEMVGEFFKKIKNYFDHILVISHNSLIRNWSDNIIMIKKEENVSSVDFITTKIS